MKVSDNKTPIEDPPGGYGQNTVFPGYAIPGYHHRWLAVYIPEYHQIWTNPWIPQSDIEGILWEEFIHAMHTTLRPAALCPLRNFLVSDSPHPGHEEFADLVEALCFASYPLALEKPVDPDNPPAIASPYRQLGIKILQEAARLAEYCSSTEGEPRRDALWGLTTALFSVIPLAPGQGPHVLDVVSTLAPQQRWRTAHDLFQELLLHLSECVKQAEKENRPLPFTLIRSNDPHELIIKSTTFLLDFLDAPLERVVPTVPALLSVASLGLHRDVYLFWLRGARGVTGASIEIWSFLEENISVMSTALRQQGLALGPPVRDAPCPAYRIYAQMGVFLRELTRRKQHASPGYLVHEMLELLIYLLNELKGEAGNGYLSCRNCQTAFLDERFVDAAEQLIKTPARKKIGLFVAASQHANWLRTDCLREIKEKLGINAEVKIARFVGAKDAQAAAPCMPEMALHAYSFPAPKGEFWAKFLPALGQVWIMPNCPDDMVPLVLAHEIHHYSLCSLQVSQMLPLKHALLDRSMPAPDRFNGIVEACYVLGITLASGSQPEPCHFPPAPQNDLQLAAEIADMAKALADKAASSVQKAQAPAEAGKALLFLLHHVQPEFAGVGPVVLQWIRGIVLPRPWQDTWHLWAMLHQELSMRLEKSAESVPFSIMLPAEPHRHIYEMLMFLSHALTPIPERQETTLMTFPALLDLLMLGSLSCTPVIRIKELEGALVAEISVIHNQLASEEAVRRTLQAHSRTLGTLQEQGVRCACMDYFVKLLTGTAEYRTLKQPDRLVKCLSYILEHLEPRRFSLEVQSCPTCKHHLSPSAVKEAIDVVAERLAPGKSDLLRAAQSYESWLLSDCLKLLQNACKLDRRIKPEKQYDYL